MTRVVFRNAALRDLEHIAQDTSTGRLPSVWSWVFNGALGELRGVFGVHLARLAVAYGIDVEDDLGSILPGEDE